MYLRVDVVPNGTVGNGRYYLDRIAWKMSNGKTLQLPTEEYGKIFIFDTICSKDFVGFITDFEGLPGLLRPPYIYLQWTHTMPKDEMKVEEGVRQSITEKRGAPLPFKRKV